jgi:hypothetical protein
MGVLDLVNQPGQKIAYLFPEIPFTPGGKSSEPVPNSNLSTSSILQDVFVFQFWPQQVTDRYRVNYATKQIPGASHPLYQWTGGGGRTISFDATFVSEISESSWLNAAATNLSFNAMVQLDLGLANLPQTVGSAASSVTAAALPSSRYTINVAAALASLQRYLYGTYHNTAAKSGITEPPRKLMLVLPGTSLGRATGVDGILCILMSADVTMESFFPSGEIRAATVSLEFAETIQYTVGQGTQIRYIGADSYKALASQYTLAGTAQNFSSLNM